MKKITTLLTVVLLSLMATKTYASGGPDAYGYTWMTSLDAGGPAFSWVDIASRPGVQTVTGLADDNSAAGMINIGFNFHFYWNDYSQLKVGSNGWVSFNSNVSNIASCFPTIPTPGGAGDNLLCPLMGDLNFTGAGNPGVVKYWTNSVDSFIISYINVPFWTVSAPGWVGPNTFQIILCNNDSSIKFQYGAMGAGFVNNAACIDMTVGIENSTGNIGLQVHTDAMPPSNYVILFDYPATVLLSIQDALPRWNTNSTNTAEFVMMNTPWQLTTDYANAGNTAISTTINLSATIYDPAMTSVFNTVGSLPSLAAGDDTVFTFTTGWTPTIAGQYTYSSSLTNSQDINAANNTTNTELDVVNVCGASINLNYLTTGTPNGSLNWNGGANDDGAAVYYAPPVYPYTISALQYYISSNVSHGFIAQVYDDDGPGGSAGTLLFTQTVTTGIITANWNTVPVSPAVTLPSGGFYVVWLQTGTTIFLGTETNGPRSHQNYEILDGSWARYRSDDLQDLCIRAAITGYTNTPTATFTSSVAGQSASFTDHSSGLVTSWSWDFGDSQTSTQQNPTHMYATPGTYTVCLTAASPCTTNVICQTVNVCIAPIASYSTSTNQLAATFTDLTVGTVSSWSWDFGDSQTSTQQSPVHTYATPGTYNVCLIIGNNCGDADTVCTTITVCAQPTAAFSSSNNIFDVTFTDATTNVPTSWEWDFGDSQTSFQQNPVHSYAAPGTYNVCLVATNACGDDDTVCQVVTVCALPVATFNLSQNEDTAFVTDQSSGTIVSWLWDFGDSQTSTSQNAQNVYATGGVYTVCLTTTDACGNTDSTCQQVFIIITSLDDESSAIAGTFPNPVNDRLTVILKNATSHGTLEIFDASGRRVVTQQEMAGKQLNVDAATLPSGIYLLRLVDEHGSSTVRFVRE